MFVCLQTELNPVLVFNEFDCATLVLTFKGKKIDSRSITFQIDSVLLNTQKRIEFTIVDNLPQSIFDAKT